MKKQTILTIFTTLYLLQFFYRHIIIGYWTDIVIFSIITSFIRICGIGSSKHQVRKTWLTITLKTLTILSLVLVVFGLAWTQFDKSIRSGHI